MTASDRSLRNAPAGGLALRAYEAIKRDIIRCELEPGARVSRAQLVERYGFGETVVREALNRLAQEQLVQPIPREGYLVAPVTLKLIQDLFDLRLVLEPAIARRASGRVDADELRQLVSQDEALYQFTDRDGLEAFVRANTAFHMAVARASGNDRMVSVMASLLDEMERVMHLSYIYGERPADNYQAHSILLEALIAGDSERASQLVEEQLLATRQRVLDSLLSWPVLQEVNLAAGGTGAAVTE